MAKNKNNNINGSLAEDGLMYGEIKDNTNVIKNRQPYTYTSAMTFIREGIMEGINLKCHMIDRNCDMFTLHCTASDGCDFVFNIFNNMSNSKYINNRLLCHKLNILSIADNYKDYIKNRNKEPNWINLTGKSFYAMFSLNEKGYLQLIDIDKVKDDDGLNKLKQQEEEQVAKDFFK